MSPAGPPSARRGIPLRAVAPNAVTALALCFGLTGIRFGSRVDVYLPSGTAPRIALGQRTIAGETVIARLGEAERNDGVAQ